MAGCWLSDGHPTPRARSTPVSNNTPLACVTICHFLCVLLCARACRFVPESEHGANAGLAAARTLLEPVKAAYPWISYADLWTLAGAVAIEAMGGAAHAYTITHCWAAAAAPGTRAGICIISQQPGWCLVSATYTTSSSLTFSGLSPRCPAARVGPQAHMCRGAQAASTSPTATPAPQTAACLMRHRARAMSVKSSAAWALTTGEDALGGDGLLLLPRWTAGVRSPWIAQP
jgi:Peroxidase